MTTAGGMPPAVPPETPKTTDGGDGEAKYLAFLASSEGVVGEDGGVFADWPDQDGIDWALRVAKANALAADQEISRLRGAAPTPVGKAIEQPMFLTLKVSPERQYLIYNAWQEWQDHGCAESVQIGMDTLGQIAEGIFAEWMREAMDQDPDSQ